jgi:hypothetical protein
LSQKYLHGTKPAKNPGSKIVHRRLRMTSQAAARVKRRRFILY